MSFLVLLILIAIEKFSNGRQHIQKDTFWLNQLHTLENNEQALKNPNWVLIKLTILPIIIISFFIFLLHNVFHGLLLFIIDILILLYALGRGNIYLLLGSFRDAWRRKDTEGLKIAAKRDLNLNIENEDPIQLLKQTQAKLLWQSYEGFFAVIFWYILLGPLMALFYRLISLLEELTTQPLLKEKASKIRYWLDWLPSRALVFSFCLVGHFTASNEILVNELFNKKTSPKELLYKAGIAATDTEITSTDEKEVATLDTLWNLLIRSAILWYVTYALIIIFIL